MEEQKAQGAIGATQDLWGLATDWVAYKEAQRFRRDSFRATSRSTTRALRENYRTLLERAQEERTATIQAISSLHDQSMRALGAAAAASASQGGGGGRTVGALLNQIGAAELKRVDAAFLNLRFTTRQLSREGKALQESAYQQLLNAIGSPIARPDTVDSILSAGGKLASGFAGG